MELFSEIYNCYYQVVDQILREAETHPVTKRRMHEICGELGFAESSLYIIPKLISGEWNLLTPEKDGYQARTKAHQDLPFTLLQRSWLKTLLKDDRFRLFFTVEELFLLNQYTEDADVLWRPEDFRCYDQYADGDPFTSPSYGQHFRTLLAAIKKRQYVHISYQSEKGNRITHHYLPLKLEYSAKNDRFRLLAVPKSQRHSAFIQTLNLRGITETILLPVYDEEDYDFEKVIRKSYYQEPVRLLIKNRRNALERTMLHFSNYEKRTRKIDEDTWECLIYYNRSMETELLIEILSFGPTVKVTGPDSFVALVKERLKRQAAILRL
ncbi:MAG: WYL domain-containing protein [Lachnospiraceae bacterium]|nr:WYL domain-containing protein [Lachnospiraceae bacterium]